ncbi:uncharacterized protein LY79DRAFT_511970 [Colletotrichum navitas]|uniref:Ilp is an apoptosis inhibitor n=1 Tax=Colletotrichum navitas TaxID=681940 RepID=A0AAD8V5B7_9PEZI|nr:uncharacterized protein LY79DRAFT_511970 [Colletotrichum navitas]KAK1594842.1 hypothetical protein LY79DRAFT_511970 [Colletotrichum navitas]
MAYYHSSGSSAASGFEYTQVGHSYANGQSASHLNGPPFQPFQESQFDIFEWYPQFQSCLRYFLDHAQYNGPIQAVAAFVNIQLPFQKTHNPVLSSKHTGPNSPAGPGPGPSTPSTTRATGKMPLGAQMPTGAQVPTSTHTTLTPYIRRLVATGFDYPAVLHGFFGDDWVGGIGPMHEAERRNYMFAAKSETWLKVKSHYDMDGEQHVPFLRPLSNVTEKEIQSAEAQWSEWLAMQDWMVGPRAPEQEPKIKQEND